MFETAFIVHVPEAEGHVASMRNRFDASVRLGVPAHVTVLVPFMAPDQVTQNVLAEIQAALSQVPSFAFTLAERISKFGSSTAGPS